MVSAITVIALGDIFSSRRVSHVAAFKQIATSVSGWEVRTLALAETPEQSKIVESTLDYDCVYNLQYTKDDFRISVYAAYWMPGKTPIHLVARHTPDVCWVAAGWRSAIHAQIENLALGPNTAISHAEHRIFMRDEQTEHVCFFHVIDGEISSLTDSDREVGPLLTFINNVFRYEFFFWHIWRKAPAAYIAPSGSAEAPNSSLSSFLFRQRGEQMFIRISSNRPISEFWATSVPANFISQMPIRTVPLNRF